MKSAFLLLLIITATPLAFGQTPSPSESASVCNLTFAQLPAIRGLKLGMSPNEVLALFPGASEDENIQLKLRQAKHPLPPTFNPGDDAYGIASFQLYVASYPNNPQFTGISHAYFRFFDDKLVSLSFSYPKTIWNSTDELITKLVETYKLPSVSAWSSNPQTNNSELTCRDFLLTVHASVGSFGQSSLALSLLKPGWNAIHRQQQERRAATIAKAQRDFKP